jgi:hypothetical protein
MYERGFIGSGFDKEGLEAQMISDNISFVIWSINGLYDSILCGVKSPAAILKKDQLYIPSCEITLYLPNDLDLL